MMSELQKMLEIYKGSDSQILKSHPQGPITSVKLIDTRCALGSRDRVAT